MIYVFIVAFIVGFSIVISKYFKVKDREDALKYLGFVVEFIVKFIYLSFGFATIFILVSLFLIPKIMDVNFRGNIYCGFIFSISGLIFMSSLCIVVGGLLAYCYSYINFLRRKLLN